MKINLFLLILLFILILYDFTVLASIIAVAYMSSNITYNILVEIGKGNVK